MYGRQIDGSTHTFGVSGKLIMNALVMYDHQTNTLWSQFLSRGVEGQLVGVELDAVPATQTTWAAWAALHPDTLALDKGGRHTADDPYTGYYNDDRRGVLGESNPDDRLDAKQLVVGVEANGEPKAYPFETLRQRGVVNDRIGGEPVLVFFDATTDTALVFDRNVDGTELEFRVEGEPAGIHTLLVDEQTGSRWSAFTGRATAGELSGKTMQRIPSHLSFWFAWTDWNPQTALFE